MITPPEFQNASLAPQSLPKTKMLSNDFYQFSACHARFLTILETSKYHLGERDDPQVGGRLSDLGGSGMAKSPPHFAFHFCILEYGSYSCKINILSYGWNRESNTESRNISFLNIIRHVDEFK